MPPLLGANLFKLVFHLVTGDDPVDLATPDLHGNLGEAEGQQRQ